MTFAGWTQVLVFTATFLALAKPMGLWLHALYDGKDRLCLPRQAARAKAAFPTAELHWFESSGHFPAWDMPGETVAVILAATR